MDDFEEFLPGSGGSLEKYTRTARLADAHRDRLSIEDRLREALKTGGFIIDRAQIEAAHGQEIGTTQSESNASS